MNTSEIDAAIAAHEAWKEDFRRAIDGGADDSFVKDSYVDDASCALGKWLKQNDQKLQSWQLLPILHSEHSSFHRVANQILGLIKGNQPDQASRLLNATFSSHSRMVVSLLRKLQTHDS